MDDERWAGAPPDEDLEAALAAEPETYDADQPRVMTMLGAIAPGALGVTVFTPEWPPAEVPPAVALAEMEAAYALGVRAIAVLGAPGPDRTDELAWLAARSPLHLVAAALAPSTPEEISAGIVNSASDEAPAAPRLPIQLVDIDAAAPAVAAGEAPPPTATGPFVAVFDRAPADYAAMGAWLAAAWRAGAGDRLLAGFVTDPGSLLERLPLALMAAGLPAVAVRRILIENPMDALTISPTVEIPAHRRGPPR